MIKDFFSKCWYLSYLMNDTFYTPVERRDVLWNRPVRLSVRPSTIACERNILKTACRIDLILLRPRTLLIWGILRKPRLPPQQFED